MSQVARGFNQLVADVRRRPVKAGPYPFCWPVAPAGQVRDGGTIDVHTPITNCANNNRHRTSPDDRVTSGAGRLTSSRGLVARDLSGVRLAPDRHAGQVDVIAEQRDERIHTNEKMAAGSAGGTKNQEAGHETSI